MSISPFSIKSQSTQVSSKLKSRNIIPDDFRVLLLECRQGLLEQKDHLVGICTLKLGGTYADSAA